MSLDALNILRKGLKQTFTPTGLKLIGAFYILNVVARIVNDSLMVGSTLPGQGFGATATPLAVSGIPSVALGGLFAVSIVANIWLALGSLRNLVNENYDSIDREYFTENLTMPALNMIAGTIVFTLLVGLGTLLFIVPGIYLMVSLLFWSIFVAVENDSFVDALRNSWDLTKGNRLDLFLIGLGVVVIGFIASIAIGVPSALLSFVSPAVSALLALVGNTFGTVFGLVTLAHAYNELQ